MISWLTDRPSSLHMREHDRNCDAEKNRTFERREGAENLSERPRDASIELAKHMVAARKRTSNERFEGHLLVWARGSALVSHHRFPAIHADTKERGVGGNVPPRLKEVAQSLCAVSPKRTRQQFALVHASVHNRLPKERGIEKETAGLVRR
jgi:hypothetical protein